jgi:hypothetical protein
LAMEDDQAPRQIDSEMRSGADKRTGSKGMIKEWRVGGQAAD